ncbi:hypothetical protein [Rahnella aquatilis]|nr:hypothetical protein [Rahnella aquatilis]
MLTKLDEHFKKVSRQEVEDISQFTAFETQRLTENGKLIKERFAELKNIIGSSSQ